MRADEARLALRILGARLDRDSDGLLVFFVCIILFCVAAAVDSFTNLLVAAAPVVMLASGVAVAQFAPNTSRRVVGQWGGAGGACCEDHGWSGRVACEFSRGVMIFCLFLVAYKTLAGLIGRLELGQKSL